MNTKFKKITNDVKVVRKLEISCVIVGNVKWYSGNGYQYGVSSRIKIELPFDLAILFLDMFPK